MLNETDLFGTSANKSDKKILHKFYICGTFV